MVTIADIQGKGLYSPMSGERVTTEGIVSGHSRRGFFIQAPARQRRNASSGLFVFSPDKKLAIGYRVRVTGTVVDYMAREGDKPNTQLKLKHGHVLGKAEPLKPVRLNPQKLWGDPAVAAHYLNNLEGMLVSFSRGATFTAPSNLFGDYTIVPANWPGLRSAQGGLFVDADQPGRWLPSFRILDYAEAPVVDVGAGLLSPVVGPLNYRSGAYQIVATKPVRVSPARAFDESPTHLVPDDLSMTVMTLNSFNLDPHIERAQFVADPDLDIDDDLGDGRFDALALSVVTLAACPDIVALQEIQDEDGAEQTVVTSARRTFECLVEAIHELGGPRYGWIDYPPQSNEDGGQPGGNIRNGFLYRRDRIEWQEQHLVRLFVDEPAFEDSRKPVLATFRHKATDALLTVINVHLASKRHQHSIFADDRPGFDPREDQRIAQCRLIRRELETLQAAGRDYYVTGDFNDFEFSASLKALVGPNNVNLVQTLPAQERYDYNHRGQLQVLMHGIVGKNQYDEHRCRYEILHGNELAGARPGSYGGKASDHAYVLFKYRAEP